ncbi:MULTISPECIES: ATP-binding protein [unclassified Streptomyces]|uniref:ATP-binding protein n=1 Tax=unclassified Streptomyces TaxID=2593676 RepID=UPI00037546FE|nr:MULTISPECIES: ATP-binding protein [unclassified Streptomyces]MYT29006.1 ATP-binding protein [Streptomyces sp. SID8354]
MNSTVRSSGVLSRIDETQSGIGEFAMRFTSTRRGARLARRLTSHRLDEWGYAYDTEINESVSAIVGELAANAVRHGHVPGRDFALRLTVSVAAAETRALRFRAEVSDTRSERLPMVPPGGGAGAGADGCDGLAESGRGLLIVACLADRWGVVPRQGGPGKTVWAEYVRVAGAAGH